MDDRLKQLMQRLGNAINESLSDSEGIAEVIGEIKHSGYDVFLVLEATIGFNKRRDENQAPGEETAGTHTFSSKVSFTRQDKEFLSALKISSPD